MENAVSELWPEAVAEGCRHADLYPLTGIDPSASSGFGSSIGLGLRRYTRSELVKMKYTGRLLGYHLLSACLPSDGSGSGVCNSRIVDSKLRGVQQQSYAKKVTSHISATCRRSDYSASSITGELHSHCRLTRALQSSREGGTLNQQGTRTVPTRANVKIAKPERATLKTCTRWHTRPRT